MKKRMNHCMVAVFLLAAAILLPLPSPVRGEDESREYVVKKGDTLWDISAQFLFDPFRWPWIWDRNREVENPHLIYPGQRLLIFPGAPPSAVVVSPAPTPAVPAPAVVIPPVPSVPIIPPAPREEAAPEPGAPPEKRAERKGVPRALPQEEKQELIRSMATYGFIIDRREFGIGTIGAAESGRKLLTQGDRIDLVLPSDSPVTGGGKYSIVRVFTEIRHPLTGRSVGYLARIMGSVQVLSAEGGKGKAEVAEIYGPAQVGDNLMEFVDYLSWIPKEPGSGLTRKGVIVANPDGMTVLGKGDPVFLDLGAGDGLGPGDVLRIVDSRKAAKDSPRVLEPREESGLMGEVVVVVPREKTAVALITSSVREISLGAEVTAAPPP